MAYWSVADDDPPTYHTCANCPSGQQILRKNRETGSPPADREKCEICATYESNGVCK